MGLQGGTQINESIEVVDRQIPSAAVTSLTSQNINPIMARLLAARGVADSAEVNGGMSDLLPVSDLKNAREMAGIIMAEIRAGKSFLVVADYDADGATACAIMLRGLEAHGAKIGYLVPDRMVHGYGLTPLLVTEAKKRLPDILITVDNGISSVAGVAEANRLGMEVLVTDHHLPGAVLPAARCIVNPNQPGCGFESKSLAGCGVAWYIVKAMDELAGLPAGQGAHRALLPLVATGTIADVVSLDKNNRILVRNGLEMIRAGVCQEGILALIDVAKRPMETLTSSDIGFSVGPRINAAGRLESMDTGIECLRTDDRREALKLARALDEINGRRQEINNDMLDEVMLQVGDLPVGKKTLVAYDGKWHEGVVGIVAGKLKEAWHRPTFVFTDAASTAGIIKGSGRSIPGLHLKDVIDRIALEIPEFIVTYGGHAMAAGIALKKGGVDAFKHHFERIVDELMPGPRAGKQLVTDGELDFDEMSRELADDICREVWGSGFPEPVFRGRFQVESVKRMGEEGKHAKLVISKDGADVDAVWFYCEQDLVEGELLDAAYRISMNSWRGKVSVQLMLDGDGTRPAATPIPVILEDVATEKKAARGLRP